MTFVLVAGGSYSTKPLVDITIIVTELVTGIAVDTSVPTILLVLYNQHITIIVSTTQGIKQMLSCITDHIQLGGVGTVVLRGQHGIWHVLSIYYNET